MTNYFRTMAVGIVLISFTPVACLPVDRESTPAAVTDLASQEQDVERAAELPHFGGLIDKCVALQETAVPQVRPSSWRLIRQWSNEEVTQILVEVTSASGDWLRKDEYCFDQDGNIAGLYSDLRTFYAGIKTKLDKTKVEGILLQVIRTWKYHPDGSIESLGTSLTDMRTKEPVASDDVGYMDNPPHLAANYEDLDEYLGLPTLQ